MKHTIVIENLNFDTTIGIYDWEQAILQPLRVDVRLECDLSKAFFTNNIDDTLNYKAICDDIIFICHEQKAQLLEKLSYAILKQLFERYECHTIYLKLTKSNAIKQTSGVGIELEMTRQEFDTLANTSIQ